MSIHNFIKNRKALICLIAVFAIVLAALLGTWIWLSRAGTQAEGTATRNTTQTTPLNQPTSGQPSHAEPTAEPSGNIPDAPSGTIPSQPGASEPTQPDNPAVSPGGATKPNNSGAPSKSDGDGKQETAAPKPDEPLLTCDNFSLYSGQYVEDGRDTLVTNVAAVLVTNRSGQFLDLATLTFEIDGKEATFRVSGLPAGRSAWVLEASRMTATNSSTFTFVDMVTGFKENVISSTDKFSITCVGNLVTATNKSSQKIENVFVYYRVLHTDGNYLGGITYVIDFGTLEPGQSVEKLAGHFSAEKARIVRIGWSGQ